MSKRELLERIEDLESALENIKALVDEVLNIEEEDDPDE